MLLNESIFVEKQCPRRWTVLAAVSLTALAVMLSGVGYRAEAAPDEQVVIVVRPQNSQGQTAKQPEIRIIVTTGDATKVDRVEDAIVWQIGKRLSSPAPDAWVELANRKVQDSPQKDRRGWLFQVAPDSKALAFSPDGKWIATENKEKAIRLWNVESGSAQILPKFAANDKEKTIRLWEVNFGFATDDKEKAIKPWDVNFGWAQSVPKEGNFLFVNDFIIIEKFAAQDVSAWVLQPSDNLTPLRNALKSLEVLQKRRELTNDAIQAAVTKAMQEMKALSVSPVQTERVNIEIVLGGQKDAKEQKGPQIVLGVEDLQKLLTELDRLKSAATAYLAAQDAYKKELEKELAKTLTEKRINELQKVRKDKELEKAFLENRIKAITLLNEARLRELHRHLEALGITAEGLDPAMAEQLQLPKNVGLLVTAVVEKGPFDKAGIRVDDILMKIAGAMVPGSVEEFNKFIGSLKTDVPLEVVVLRKGKMETAGKLTLLNRNAVTFDWNELEITPDLVASLKAKDENKAKPAKSEWSKWGTLRKTTIRQDNQTLYRLEDESGGPLGYAVAAPGLTLEHYVGRMVCLYGNVAFRNSDDYRGSYTIVSQLTVKDDQ